MRGIAVFWIAVLAVLIAEGSVLAGEGLTKVSENVYSYVGVEDDSPAGSFGANAGIVVGRNGILVVDTLVSARKAQRFIADIRKVSDRPPPLPKKDIQDMKDYLVELDRRAREISGNSGDPDYITAEMIKVLPSRKHGAGLIIYSIVMKYLKKKE